MKNLKDDFWENVKRKLKDYCPKPEEFENVEELRDDIEFAILEKIEETIEEMLEEYAEELMRATDILFDYNIKVNKYGWSKVQEKNISELPEFQEIFKQIYLEAQRESC